MSPRHRRIAGAFLVALACALPAGSAQAAPTTDNVAKATVETDGAHVSDFAWDISRQRGGEIRQYNSAQAAARCTDCGATAIAFQIVLAWGRPNPVEPVNEAVAVNLECTRCAVAAEARQFVRVVDAPARFDGAGKAELADVRRDLRALAGQDLPPLALNDAVEQQEARVLAVLRNHLVLRSDTDEEPGVIDSELQQDADVG